MTRLPTTGMDKYYLGLEKGLEKVSVEVWEPWICKARELA